MNNLDLIELECQLGDDFYKEVYGFPDYIMNMNGRIIKKIDGYEPKVRLCKGYYVVNLNKDGKQTTAVIHNLKGRTFLNDYKEGDEIHHINENKLDNKISNLKVMSKKEHSSHHKTGEKNPRGMKDKHHSEETKWKMSANHTDYSGEKNPNSKLSNFERMAVVLKMIEKIKDGVGITQAAKILAKIYPVSYHHIKTLYYKYINNKKGGKN